MSKRPHINATDALLKAQGLRVTLARRGVYRILEAAPEPLSAGEVSAQMELAGMGIDLVTVYRTLEALEECGLITPVEHLADGRHYAIAAREHHHSITCSKCRNTAPLNGCALKELEGSLAKSTGYTHIRHSLQFYGVCPNCSIK